MTVKRESGKALESLALSYAGLTSVVEAFEAASDGIERRRLLVSMVAQAWRLRDDAADAYAALEIENWEEEEQ